EVLDVLRRDQVVAVDVPGDQRLLAVVLLGNGLEDHLLDLRLLFAPVVIVGLQRDLVLPVVPLGVLVGPGTGDVTGLLGDLRIGHGLRVIALRCLVLIGLQRLGAV